LEELPVDFTNITTSNFHTVLVDGKPDMFCDRTARAEYWNSVQGKLYWASVQTYLDTVVLDVNTEADAYASRDEDEEDHSDDVTFFDEPLAWS
jgi:hypothetical protein